MTAKLCRCPDCGRSWTDPEAAYAHVMAGCPSRPLMIRRRGMRRAA